MVCLHFSSQSKAFQKRKMASPAPVKSHPLHNFSLPLWNWSEKQGSAVTAAHTHLRSRKVTADTVQRSPPPPPPAYGETSGSASPSKNDSERRRSPAGDGGSEGRSKILIRFRTKGKAADDVVAEDEGRGPGAGEEVAAAAAEESGPKTWNLRPRRAACKGSKAGGEAAAAAAAAKAAAEIKNESAAASSWPESARCRNSSEARAAEKKEKAMRFAIPLSKDEIEEDVFALTGSKPSRRPRKRARIIQKQLDNAFPGLWLASITPDAYRVSETPAKG